MQLRAGSEKFSTLTACLQSPLLLVVRLYWGWAFFATGKAALLHLDRTTRYFVSIDIPLPQLNAILAGGAECLGGLLLLLGGFSRASSALLVFVMSVAYAMGERASLRALFNDPDKFTSAPPFLFLSAALLVLAFGPGKFSLDHFWSKKNSGPSS